MVGHRTDVCPGPRPDKCGLCGTAAHLIDGEREPHECIPRCTLCGGAHATGTRSCTAKYRPLQHQRSEKGHRPNPKRGRRKRGKRRPKQPVHQRDDSDHPKQRAPPAGPIDQGKKDAPLLPQQQAGKQATGARPEMQRAWVNAVKQGTKDWEATLLGCSTLQEQRALVARAKAAAEATGVPD
ncbi:uncharacterized protein LOC142570434 [Dermacentor variabilis]|uniref:uncharacterized protein LOC142570434 n=1 Tax=Dermacentor variabilis TaxID=34621 RepID=UPI003F5BA26E